MLSGDPPFSADSAMSLLMQHLNDPVPDLSTKRQDLPRELIRIVNKSLEKDRENRYRSASEMAGDLKRFLATLETESAPTALPTPKADPAIVETKRSTAPQAEDQTEPWNVSTPSVAHDESVFDEATKVDESTPVAAVADTAEKTPSALTEEIQRPVVSEKPKPVERAPMSPLIKFGGAGIIGLILLVGGWFAFRNVFSAAPEPTATSTATNPAATAIVPVNTDTPTITPTDEPTSTPTIEPTATSTLPPLYVRINGITVNETGFYVVEYETFGYTEQLPGQHIHFFFNTVSVEQAGLPGKGPWELYGGPRPFVVYRVVDKPAAATQMCALVANANHSIIPESGNCLDLPQ
jgi:serine/threonine protein kinase